MGPAHQADRIPLGAAFLIALLSVCILPDAALAAAPDEQPPPRTAPPEAAASEPTHLYPGVLPRVTYPETALRFGVPDFVITVLGGGAALTGALIGPDRENGPKGGVWFDEDVRNALRPSDFNTQLVFRDTSDVLLGLSLAYVFIGDALIHVSWMRKSPEVAQQMALIDAEVAAIAFGASQFTANMVSRERPYGRTCGTSELDEKSAQCTTNDRYLSHFSGHSTLTFAMAAVTCAHHSALDLSAGKAWIPCLSGFTTAAVTATFRIAGDMHYATDVLTGAAVGTLVGFAVPAVHYGIFGLRPKAAPLGGRVSVVPTFGGLSLSGVW